MVPTEYLEKTKNLPHSALLEEALTYIKNKNAALELGPGGGRDTKFLLVHGFKVTAVDQDPVIENYLKTLPHQENLTFITSSFDGFQFQSYDLITAFNSLPFHPKTLSMMPLFEKIKSALNPYGIFTGNLFGSNDSWNVDEDRRTFINREEAERLLKDLEIIKFEELEYDKTNALGTPKHWHIFHFIARNKPLGRISDDAKKLYEPDLDKLIKNIQFHIQRLNHYNPRSRLAKTILESCFTPAQEAYDLGLKSCGNTANIAAEMLRSLGYEVKLIHGRTAQTPTHAWLKVKNKKGDWHEFDLNKKDLQPTPDYQLEYEVDSWEEIRPFLEDWDDKYNRKA